MDKLGNGRSFWAETMTTSRALDYAVIDPYQFVHFVLATYALVILDNDF